MSTHADGPPSQQQTLAAVIKDEIILIGSLVFFVGIISTDTYYSKFGISYQFLDLPTFHIIYRGITMVLDAPCLVIPYILAVVWFVVDSFAAKKGHVGFIHYRGPTTYLVILILLAISYPLASRAGSKKAKADLYQATSMLPKIVYLELKTGEKFTLGDGFRLLVIDSSYVVFFKPLEANATSTFPNIKRFPKENANVIETNPP